MTQKPGDGITDVAVKTPPFLPPQLCAGTRPSTPCTPERLCCDVSSRHSSHGTLSLSRTTHTAATDARPGKVAEMEQADGPASGCPIPPGEALALTALSANGAEWPLCIALVTALHCRRAVFTTDTMLLLHVTLKINCV